jgi:hypothetical protein
LIGPVLSLVLAAGLKLPERRLQVGALTDLIVLANLVF